MSTKDSYPQIETLRLLLRRYKASDSDMITFLRTDKVVTQYIDRAESDANQSGLEFITKINVGIENKSLFSWAITEKGKDVMIGSICLWNISEDRKTAEVGYDLHPNYQKKGIMNESLIAVIQFGFEEMMLDHIEAFTHRDNANSKQLLERNGFKLEEQRTDKDNANNQIFTLSRMK